MFATSTSPENKPSLWGDAFVLALFFIFLYFFVGFASRLASPLEPSPDISLSLWSLPKYAFFSFARASLAYLLSLCLTLILGYAAAKNKVAERVILPFLDIGQSIPVLGFMPGLILGLISLFPHYNMGLELACIIMILTSQMWNMAFSYYASIKDIPQQYYELGSVIGLNWKKTMTHIELPFSATALAWNSLISMAGGWFFLTVCESFKLGEKNFRIPGLGSFITLAIEQGNTKALVFGIITMVLLIVVVDFLFWRPILAWSEKFRLEETLDQTVDIPFVTLLLQESWIINNVIDIYRHLIGWRQRWWPSDTLSYQNIKTRFREEKSLSFIWKIADLIREKPYIETALSWCVYGLIILLLFVGIGKVFDLIEPLTWTDWSQVLLNTFWTLVRVTVAVVLSTAWALPVGIWIGASPKLTKIFQPLIQIAASFPAPMVYPLVLIPLFYIGIPLGISSIFLMMMGVQWYVLFNVLAGASRISNDVKDSLELIQVTKKTRWRDFYIPSVFPSLVTGWNTAAGGAWNASIVCEYVIVRQKPESTLGLGALISQATETGNMPLLGACILSMVIVVVGLNRTLWRYLFRIAEERYRFER